MTWSASIPNASASPASFPTQAQTNWSRLQAIITADHLFSTSSSSDQGYHKIVHWVNQGGDLGDNSPAPSTGVGQLYTKTVTTTGISATAGAGEHLCYQRGTNGAALQEASLSACPVRASVNFDSRSSNGAATINWGFNVADVQRTAEGRYTINFTTDLPSTYYIVTGSVVQASIVTATRSATVVSRVKAVGSVQITCSSQGGNLDPDSFDIVIYGG